MKIFAVQSKSNNYKIYYIIIEIIIEWGKNNNIIELNFSVIFKLPETIGRRTFAHCYLY